MDQILNLDILNLLFRESSSSNPQSKTILSAFKFKRTHNQENRPYKCLSCLNKITDTSSRKRVIGNFKHNFINPAGLVFHIGCFKKANGILCAGEPTNEYTWFKGYTWNLAYCAHCTEHLGWHFQNARSSFYGLNLTKIYLPLKSQSTDL
jgi:hypothetical protein